MSDRPEDTSHPEDELHDLLPRRNHRERRLDTLSKEEKKTLARRGITEEWLCHAEREIQELLRLKREQGSLYGTRAREDAAQRLKVNPSTINRMMKKYENNPVIDVLIPGKRGANRGQRLTTEQKQVICSLYLKPITVQVGSKTIRPGRSTSTYIHQVLSEFYPPPVSKDTVYRYIQGLQLDHSLMVDMARRGEKYIRDRVMPTPSFNVERSNQVWQMDARPLPIYVRHNGIITTPSLLLIVDHKSHYPLRARLIPRAVLDRNGKMKRADVRNEDVGILLASTMYELGIRPEKLYTDNGSSIVGVGDMLANLRANGLLLTQFTRSIPGRPRGRGVVERMLQAFDQVLFDLPANLIPDPEDPNKQDHFTMISKARQAETMLPLEGMDDGNEGLEWFLNDFMETLRDEPKRESGKDTRRQLWTSSGALPAFPIRELMRLLPDERQVSREAAIDHHKITFLKEEHGGDFEPRIDSDQDWDKWLVASSRPEMIPLRAMNIDTGWKVEVCLDRDASEPYWCELILKDEQRIDKGYRMEQINRSLKRVRAQYAELTDKLRAVDEEMGLNTIVKRPGAGPVRLSNESDQNDKPSPPQSPPSVSVSTSGQNKPLVHPRPKKKSVNVAALMREAEEEMEEHYVTRANEQD